MKANLSQFLKPEEHRHGIDSIQNGILLHASLRKFWDSWWMSINPVPLPPPPVL